MKKFFLLTGDHLIYHSYRFKKYFSNFLLTFAPAL
jgi:hypothetical protein